MKEPEKPKIIVTEPKAQPESQLQHLQENKLRERRLEKKSNDSDKRSADATVVGGTGEAAPMQTRQVFKVKKLTKAEQAALERKTYWNPTERAAFKVAIERYGKNYSMIHKDIPTKSRK